MSELIVKTNIPKLSEEELNFFACSLGEVIADFYKNPKNEADYQKWLAKELKKEENASENEGKTQGKGIKSQSSCGKSRNRRANDKQV